MNEEINIKQIEEETKKKEQESIKEERLENNNLINNLPTWSIEPPIEIKRGQE